MRSLFLPRGANFVVPPRQEQKRGAVAERFCSCRGGTTKNRTKPGSELRPDVITTSPNQTSRAALALW